MAFNGVDITELYEPSEEEAPASDGKDASDKGEDDGSLPGSSMVGRKRWFDVAKATTSAVRTWTVKVNNVRTSFESSMAVLESLLNKAGGTEVLPLSCSQPWSHIPCCCLEVCRKPERSASTRAWSVGLLECLWWLTGWSHAIEICIVPCSAGAQII